MEYDMTFDEAIRAVLEKRWWVQGEDFHYGVVLRPDRSGITLECYDVSRCDSHPLNITITLLDQRFKRFQKGQDLFELRG